MTTLWQGNWRTRARIISGLVLFTYVLFHFINIGLGIFSLEMMEWFQELRQVFSRSIVGGLVLYGALLLHAGLALWRLARRRTLRMAGWEMAQVVLGLAIPFMLMTHVMHTRLAHARFELNDKMGYIVGLIWDSQSGWTQALLLLVTWVHGCMGLHFWLRSQAWWRNNLTILVSGATLIPAWALAGFMVQGRMQRARIFDPETFPELAERYNWLAPENFAELALATDRGLMIFMALLAATAAAQVVRRIVQRRGAVRVTYVDGPEVSGQPGMTLLEMSRAAGVSHLALCGGRGRCTTCRVVVEEGSADMPPPTPEEAASLAAVNAPPNARLACQVRPTKPTKVMRVFRSDGQKARAHHNLGEERRLAILFLDMRGFTARTTGQLPYDVVFLLNRFFDAVVPSITGVGGTVDKYLGDGLLAVFELEGEALSAKAALEAAAGISSALQVFNRALVAEHAAPVAIGMGLHLGELVLGEIGAVNLAPRTIIGDTVNAASRMEGETKALGVELLVSAALLEAAGHRPETLELVALSLRGVLKPVDALAVKKASALPTLLQAAREPA